MSQTQRLQLRNADGDTADVPVLKIGPGPGAERAYYSVDMDASPSGSTAAYAFGALLVLAGVAVGMVLMVWMN